MFSKLCMCPLLIWDSHREIYSAKASAAKKADSFHSVKFQWIGLSTVDTWKSSVLSLCIVLCHLICAQPLQRLPHCDSVCFLGYTCQWRFAVKETVAEIIPAHIQSTSIAVSDHTQITLPRRTCRKKCMEYLKSKSGGCSLIIDIEDITHMCCSP